MERTDWLGFDSAQARFLMVTAITHHRFRSLVWAASEVRKLHAELAEMEAAWRERPDPSGRAANSWSGLRRRPSNI